MLFQPIHQIRSYVFIFAIFDVLHPLRLDFLYLAHQLELEGRLVGDAVDLLVDVGLEVLLGFDLFLLLAPGFVLGALHDVDVARSHLLEKLLFLQDAPVFSRDRTPVRFKEQILLKRAHDGKPSDPCLSIDANVQRLTAEYAFVKPTDLYLYVTTCIYPLVIFP